MPSLLELFGEKVISASKDAAEMIEFADTILPLNDVDKQIAEAFKGHYLRVLNFTPPSKLDDPSEIVGMALKAAALRAGSKQAKLPLAVVELYLRTLSEEELNEFFETMYGFADIAADMADGPAATTLQDTYFFLEYSEVAQQYMLGNPDLHKQFCEISMDAEFDEFDIATVDAYKNVFFLSDLGEDSILIDCILHPENFRIEEEDWDESYDAEEDTEPFPDVYDSDEEDLEDFDDAPTLMDAINEDNRLDPLSADYDPPEDEDEE